MEGKENLLDTIFDEENAEGSEDIAMLEFEEGELTEQFSKAALVGSSDVGLNQVNQEPVQGNSRQKRKRKKNKRKRSSSSGSKVTDINRFVLDVCKRLRERKSYLVWTAVGCLGVSALSDLVKEVDAIQACGGQKTADGKRFRNGGGILWSIIKTRDPNAYKEIMNKGKEFEKQFKQQSRINKEPTEDPSKIALLQAEQAKSIQLDGLELPSHDQSQLKQPNAGQQRKSVHDRIRLPVTYDDLLIGEDTKNESNPA